MLSNTIDICGKRTPEYLTDALTLFERKASDSRYSVINLRGIGADASKAVQIAAILKSKFGCEISNLEVGTLSPEGTESRTSYVNISMRWEKSKEYHVDKMFYDVPDIYMEYPLYSILFDRLLMEGDITIRIVDKTEEGEKTIELKLHRENDGNDSYSMVMGPDREIAEDIRAVLHRAGVLMPDNWKDIAEELSKFDDIILGIDTNILININISEHILPSLLILNPKSYAHTPNWILFVIPSTAMHEIEEWANNRNNVGLLKKRGRMGFRALQEIISLTNSADISGISLVISGATDPVIDTKIEIEGLRQDIQKVINDIGRKLLENDEEIRFSPKRSTGDMIIRDQFKEFLRGMNFHKGVYFLTADKSNAALASAEGLNSIYLKIPSHNGLETGRLYYEIPVKKKNDENDIRLRASPGKLIYELAVQFGTLELGTPIGTLEVSVDVKGEKIDYWLGKKLKIKGAGEYLSGMKLGFEYRRLSNIIQEMG
jgi:DNA-binding protein